MTEAGSYFTDISLALEYASFEALRTSEAQVIVPHDLGVMVMTESEYNGCDVLERVTL